MWLDDQNVCLSKSKYWLIHRNKKYAILRLTPFFGSSLFSSRTAVVDQAFESKKDMHAGLETELKLEKIRRSQQEKESQEMEHLRQRQAEAELELEELKKKREERRKAREDEERRREEEEQQKLAKKEVAELI